MNDCDDIEDCIARCALGDRAAFDALYASTSAKLFSICLRILNDRPAAEEALQEIYIQVWTNAVSYRVHGLSPMTWLLTVARNHATDRLRARRAASDGVGTTAGDDALDWIAGEHDAQCRTAVLHTCMSELPVDRVEPIERAYLMGETYEELSALFRQPKDAMRVQLQQTLVSLRTCLTR